MFSSKLQVRRNRQAAAWWTAGNPRQQIMQEGCCLPPCSTCCREAAPVHAVRDGGCVAHLSSLQSQLNRGRSALHHPSAPKRSLYGTAPQFTRVPSLSCGGKPGTPRQVHAQHNRGNRCSDHTQGLLAAAGQSRGVQDVRNSAEQSNGAQFHRATPPRASGWPGRVGTQPTHHVEKTPRCCAHAPRGQPCRTHRIGLAPEHGPATLDRRRARRRALGCKHVAVLGLGWTVAHRILIIADPARGSRRHGCVHEHQLVGYASQLARVAAVHCQKLPVQRR